MMFDADGYAGIVVHLYKWTMTIPVQGSTIVPYRQVSNLLFLSFGQSVMSMLMFKMDA